MKSSCRFFRAAFMITATFGAAGHLLAETYHVSFLGLPDGGYQPVQGISGTSVVGARSGDNGSEATLWNTITGSAISLNPGPGFFSIAYGVSSNTQVGYTATPSTHERAALWHGTAVSYVDLNPAGFTDSNAYGVSGNNQVGSGAPSTGQGKLHALLWHGTAASAVDLNPAGHVSSVALGVDGDNIVGSASSTGSLTSAGLWKGTTHTFTNLQPAGFGDSIGLAISQNSEVGYAFLQAGFFGPTHALLWHDTAASVIDLNPAGFTTSQANDVWEDFQVGFGFGTTTGGYSHALLWQGTAASVFDLQSVLGPDFVSSQATGINESGVIVGTAVDKLGGNYAVVWSPVPEPCSAVLADLGLAFLLGIRPARFRRCS